jgi:hypothetical protein
VSHRLNNIKKTGKATNAPSGGSAASTPAKATPKKATINKTPGSGARGRGRPPKSKATIEDESQDGSEDEVISSSVTRKRGRNGDDEVPTGKKIKTEPGEMEDMLRGVGAQFDEYDGNMAVGDEDEV